MKRIALMVAVSMAFGSALAEYNFAGIPWKTKLEDVVYQLDWDKYIYDKLSYDNDASDIWYKGNILNYDVSIGFRFNLEDELVNVTVVTEKIFSSCQAYTTFWAAFKQKYGQPDEINNKHSIQYQGILDCNQLSNGINSGDVNLSSIWRDNNSSLTVNTLKDGMIRIDYFSNDWGQEYNRRRFTNAEDL